jgi:hypothetical protein
MLYAAQTDPDSPQAARLRGVVAGEIEDEREIEI